MSKVSLETKVILGLLLGIIAGFILNFLGGDKQQFISLYIFPLLKFIGDLFIRLIRMTVVPLVLFSIIESVANIGEFKKLASVGLKTAAYILTTGLISSAIGVTLGFLFKPGIGGTIGEVGALSTKIDKLPTFYDTILAFFPSNPFNSMATADMMPIISFAIFCGAALLLSGSKGEQAKNLFSELSHMMTSVVTMVLKLTPYGTFGLMAVTIGKFGSSIIGPLMKFYALDWTGQIIIQVVVFNAIIILFARVNPVKLWKKAVEPWIVAFTTGSSMASLPLTLRIADEIGIPKRTASFVIPLGTTADMNGICCYLSLATVFAAQLFGIELTVASYFFVMLQSVILAIGAAAVPASGVVMLLTLFTALGFPLEVVAIIAGGYKIVDGIHTTTNAVGDLVLAMAVSGAELDLTKYNASKNSVDELAG